jgi:hypothetical protein
MRKMKLHRNDARGYEHANGARGTVQMRKNGLLLYLFMLHRNGARGYEHGTSALGIVTCEKSWLLLYLVMCPGL